MDDAFSVCVYFVILVLMIVFIFGGLIGGFKYLICG